MIGRRANRWNELVDRLTLLPNVAEPSTALENLDLPLEHVHRLSRGALETVGAGLRHEGVRVVAFGQRDDTCRYAVRQQLVARSKGSLQPGLIAVVQEKHVLRVFADEGRL